MKLPAAASANRTVTVIFKGDGSLETIEGDGEDSDETASEPENS